MTPGKYVSSVNVNTPSKKVWDMICKITGKNVASPMHHLKNDNGTLITRSYRHVKKYCQTINILHFVGFWAIEISEEMKMLIVQQKMLYQKHSLRILNFHVQTFLRKSSLLSHLCGRNGGTKRLVTNCTLSCPKLMKFITQDAQTEKMKLLFSAFELAIHD